jgi:hypothetical protein
MACWECQMQVVILTVSQHVRCLQNLVAKFEIKLPETFSPAVDVFCEMMTRCLGCTQVSVCRRVDQQQVSNEFRSQSPLKLRHHVIMLNFQRGKFNSLIPSFINNDVITGAYLCTVTQEFLTSFRGYLKLLQ